MLSPLWISLRIATLATAIAFCLGVSAAHWMHHYRGRWRYLLDGFFLAPLVLPPTVLGFLLLLLLGKNGPLGHLLDKWGINIIFTWYAAVVAATVVAFPLMYKTVLGAFEQIDRNLEQAARTLGASELRLFWQITLPLALPGLVAGTTLAFARALGEFGATLMLAGNIPGKTQTMPMAIYFAVEAGAFREAAAWTGGILTITLGGLTLVNLWQSRRKSARDAASKGRNRRIGRPIGNHPHPQPLNPPSRSFSPIASAPHLTVTLVKHLPDFTLNVSFSTNGQPLGLLGGSGAGKSLILRCIAGIETPDAGRIVLNGRVLFDSAKGINVPSCDRRVGFVFQNYALFPHLTVGQNLTFGLPKHFSPQYRQQIVREQLAKMHLEGMAHRYARTLSGGQQQRVALARALASQPEVLLLDEPFSALDTHLRYQLERDLRLRLAQFPGITLFVTHNVEEAYRVCNTLLVMDRGMAAACDTKSAVLDDPKTLSAARLTGCKNISRAVSVGSSAIQALDWNCTLHITRPIPPTLTHIGMRAHQFCFLEALAPKDVPVGDALRDAPRHVVGDRTEAIESRQPNALSAPVSVSPPRSNTFPCWLSGTSETPHRMTLYLKLNGSPAHPQDYHVQAEVFKDKWMVLKEMPQPWSIQLDPERLMILSDAF
ncbi:MAG: molybdate ABC transporter permease subunit [Cyanobacteriota bacterium]|nr:molybdate ABC transporter permease subunit [Cyanobacteriota bacterium]